MPGRGDRDAEVVGQPWSRHAFRGTGDVLGGPCRQDAPAVGATARAHIDDVVCGGKQVEIVVDDDDGGPRLGQPVEHTDQGGHVQRVESGGWLVEDVQDVPLAAAQPGGDP